MQTNKARWITASFISALLVTNLSFAFEVPPIINCLNDCEPLTETAPIAEESMIKRMKREVAEVDWEKVNKQIIEASKKAIHNFQPVYPYKSPKKDTVRFIDPTVVATKDIWGYLPKKGKKLTELKSMDDFEEAIIVHKGDKVNPLQFVRPVDKLFIFDPTSQEQLKLASQIKNTPLYKRVKFIATQGDIAGLYKKLGRPSFYLTNELQQRLFIEYTPTLVDVYENKIRIRSFALPFDVKKLLK